MVVHKDDARLHGSARGGRSKHLVSDRHRPKGDGTALYLDLGIARKAPSERGLCSW